VIWTSRILGYIAVVALGFVLGYLTYARQTEPKIRAYQDMLQEWEPQINALQGIVLRCEPELFSCQARYQRMGALQPAPSGKGTPGAQNPQQPAQPQQKAPAGAGKGDNGKH
jgi:hypothetical protein